MDYDVVIVRKNNKNTYIRIKEDLKVYVYTNKYTKAKEIKIIIKNNHKSINKMMENRDKNIENNKNYLLGKEIDIVVF